MTEVLCVYFFKIRTLSMTEILCYSNIEYDAV